MKIILNNREEEINLQKMSINDLIEYKNFSFKLLVTKINGKLVKRTERNEAFIQEGDNVEILHLISGG
jgi:thiamine biosynthesis protein ThiS